MGQRAAGEAIKFTHEKNNNNKSRKIKKIMKKRTLEWPTRGRGEEHSAQAFQVTTSAGKAMI